MNAQNRERTILDPRSKLAVFIAACFSTFSGMPYVQEFALLLLTCITMLLCKKWRWVATVCVLYVLLFLGDVFVVGRLSGVAQYVALLLCHITRFLLPLFSTFYVVTKTSAVGEYISAFMAMHMPGEVVIPVAVMFRFVPTVQEEWQAVTQAMKLRGMALTWRNMVRRPLFMLENMLVPFLMQCSLVVDEMSAAVMARGFDKDRPRTSYLAVRMRCIDWLMVAASLLITVWNLTL